MIRHPDTVIKGGRLVDASGEQSGDILISDGHIVAVGQDLQGEILIDAGGCIVSPGLVDLHAHLRQPGKEETETIASGARAAVLGGYTAVLAMPNTTPTIDCAAVVREVLELGRASVCDVHTTGAITVGRAGEQLAPMAEMAALGVKVFTDDGTGVQDDRLMRRAMEYASGLGLTLAQHCEVNSLSEGTCMHEGEWSARLGLPGQPSESEELMVMRDIALARLTGAKIHFQHMSTAGSAALIAAAKAKGMSITAEAAPHHFTLTDACCEQYDATFKVHPPLRAQSDLEAIKNALAAGSLDAIATDHAPHAAEDKELPFDQAPPGMLGLEYALALAFSELVDGGEMTEAEVLAAMSWRPAAIAGMDNHGQRLVVGVPANLCVIDPSQRWVIDATGGVSLSRNVPYVGKEVRGKVRHTIVFGEVVVRDGEVQR